MTELKDLRNIVMVIVLFLTSGFAHASTNSVESKTRQGTQRFTKNLVKMATGRDIEIWRALKAEAMSSDIVTTSQDLSAFALENGTTVDRLLAAAIREEDATIRQLNEIDQAGGLQLADGYSGFTDRQALRIGLGAMVLITFLVNAPQNKQAPMDYSPSIQMELNRR